MRRGAIGEAQLGEAADLNGLGICLEKISSGNARVGGRAQQQHRDGGVEGVDILDEDRTAELYAGGKDPGEASRREVTRVRAPQAGELSVRA